jgi:ribosome biogenesis GTPase
MIDVQEYGFPAGFAPECADGLLPARITGMHRAEYRAVCACGVLPAALQGAFFYKTSDREAYPAVGDFVLLRYNENGPSGIVRLLPRSSKFSRADFSGHKAGYAKHILEQVVAANFDYVFIMSSLNRDFRVNRVVRYLSAARQSGGEPVVILTKADLVDDHTALVEAVRVAAPDTPVIALSSHTGQGLEQLDAYLTPRKTVVFLGMSGVGKSSLLNTLAGEVVMEVQEIRAKDSRGRHTTTHRELFRLRSGALVIDTPGMRELGLWDADDGISASFGPIEELAAHCRFSNCRHESEPGCAIRTALADGALSPAQWATYLTQKQEAAFVENKADYPHAKHTVHKHISARLKERNKHES